MILRFLSSYKKTKKKLSKIKYCSKDKKPLSQKQEGKTNKNHELTFGAGMVIAPIGICQGYKVEVM